MKIFPAIDIKDGRCVRLVKGNFENKTEYKMSPVEQAGKYNDHGFKNLHIVDLDGALTGETVNLYIIQEIIKKLDNEIPDSLVLPPERTLIIDWPIIAQPPIPPKKPVTKLAEPCAKHSLLAPPCSPVISPTRFKVNKLSIKPINARIIA